MLLLTELQNDFNVEKNSIETKKQMVVMKIIVVIPLFKMAFVFQSKDFGSDGKLDHFMSGQIFVQWNGELESRERER